MVLVLLRTFDIKDINIIIVLIAIITLAYYCSITLPMTGIDDVRLGRVG